MSTRRKHFTTLCSVVSVVLWIHCQIHCEPGAKTVNKVQQSISPSCRKSQPCFMNERRLFKQTRVLRRLLHALTLIWGLTWFLHIRHELNLFCKKQGFVYVPTGWLSWLPVWDAGLYCSPLCSFNVKVYSESLWQATSWPQANQYIQSKDLPRERWMSEKVEEGGTVCFLYY